MVGEAGQWGGGIVTAINFTRFIDKVLSGEKRQTIRRIRKKNPIKPGVVLQLYTGQRTKAARKLVDAVCTSVTPIRITYTQVWLDGKPLPDHVRMELAQKDGFDGLADFHGFFMKHYGADFNGVVIEWDGA
jgi:hypothetical protein